VRLSAGKVRDYATGRDLEPGQRDTLAARLEALERALDDAPKSLRWRMRARVGERVKWYELPEEVKRG